MSKIKVLHCLETIGSGGVERRRLSLVKNLNPELFEQVIICTKKEGEIASLIEENGCLVYQIGVLNNIYNITPYKAAMKIVDEFEPDIIHGAVIEGYSVSAIVGRLKKVPVIVMEETSDPKNRRRKGHWLTRVMAGLSHHCIGVSPSVGDYLVNFLKIPQNKVTVINNGVRSPKLVDQINVSNIKNKLGIRGDDLVIGSVGRMNDDQKRFSDLILAFKKLEKENLKLILVGDGPERLALEKLVKKLDIENKVIFTGYVSDVDNYYSLMDVFALASYREAFGLVVAEAMRSCLPVVATNVGGIPHVVQDGKTGILVPPFNVEELSLGLAKLVNDTQLRQKYAEAGKSYADEYFSDERYVSDIQALYMKLMEERQHVIS